MNVELINYTPDPEGAILFATRTCYQSFDKQEEASDKRLLEHIVRNNESPLEFAVFTFSVSGISRAASHQIVRHRIGSYAQKSQRYVTEEKYEYVIPPAVEADPKGREVFLRMIKECQDAYDELKRLGIKNEDARYILPNACATHIVCSYNARSLRNFIKLRTSKRAQWEIKNVADKMKELVSKVAPALMAEL